VNVISAQVEQSLRGNGEKKIMDANESQVLQCMPMAISWSTAVKMQFQCHLDYINPLV